MVLNAASPHIAQRRTLILLFYFSVHRFVVILAVRRWIQDVLSGFTPRLTSHFDRSFSNHSFGYAFSNDRPNCFASHTVNSGSLVQYAG